MEGSGIIDSETSDSTGFSLAVAGIRVAPSLLAADFSRLERQVEAVERGGAEVLHLDVMDGHFVPNISFGVPVVASLRKRSRLFFDAHLMIDEPGKYAEPFVKAGCDHITFHCEAVSDAVAMVDHIHSLGVSAGVALNPTTDLRAIEEIIEAVELVLVMSVWPGFGGQKFIADVLGKVEALRGILGDHQRLEIDGGIEPGTVALAAGAGADLLVAGSAVFGRADPARAMNELHRLALDAAGGDPR